MPHIIYKKNKIFLQGDESVLDAFLRQGLSIPFSCRKGICHVCIQRCTSGTLAPGAQKGLPSDLQDKGYFLPCKCTPSDDLEVCGPDPDDFFIAAEVHDKEMLSPDICRVLLTPAKSLTYRPGQFIKVRHGNLTRSYSLASHPEQTSYLEIHVKHVQNGAVSGWICKDLKAGDMLDIQGPFGDCCYLTQNSDQPILLVGHGTGLAPLIGVIRDALHNHHRGEIHLYQGSHEHAGFYLREEIFKLQDGNPNFHYHECIAQQSTHDDFVANNVVDIAFTSHPDLHGWAIYLAGAPEMVAAGERQALAQGAMQSDIHADYFALSVLPVLEKNAETASKPADACLDGTPSNTNDSKLPAPDTELWTALEDGRLLTTILKDFYGRVFRDPKLSPFFQGTTEERLVEKQYSFLHQLITGKKVYFGDRPRNAHHWMVISEELFDHREKLLMQCMHEHGIPDQYANRLRAIEGFYRKDIVKSTPWNRIMNGLEIHRDGFGETIMDVGSVCDACSNEVAAGERVRYHLRLGSIYCANCS